MKPEGSMNRRVLIVDDQREIHEDFSEVLEPTLPEARSDEFAPPFVDSERTASVHS